MLLALWFTKSIAWELSSIDAISTKILVLNQSLILSGFFIATNFSHKYSNNSFFRHEYSLFINVMLEQIKNPKHISICFILIFSI